MLTAIFRLFAVLALSVLSIPCANAASCYTGKSFNMNATQADRDKDEAECAIKALDHTKRSFTDAIVAQEKGDVSEMCKSIYVALLNMDNYQTGDWRNSYEEIAEAVDKNHELIFAEFRKTNCPQKLDFYKKHAEAGKAWAQHNLGWLHEDGKIVPQNTAIAIEWYKKAAAQEYIDSIKNLFGVYVNGIGIKVDEVEAIKWQRKAAELGDSDSQYYMGNRYRSGIGVEVNYEKAVEWYKKAEDQGDKDATARLAEMYESGEAKKPLFRW